MFANIRNQLTMLYSAVTALFLLTFIVASFTGLLWVLYHEEQRDVQAITEEEAREHIGVLRQKEPAFQPVQKEEQPETNSGEKIFYYVFDLNGRLVSREEPASDLREKAFDIIRDWKDEDGEARLQIFYDSAGERVFIMMCSRKIYEGSNVLGTVFVGEDLTGYYHMLERLLVILIIIAVLFLFAAAYTGHILAGRAIIPIKQSFSRQKEFTADASHELRTPLSVLLTSVDAVQTDDETKLSSFSCQVLDDMKSEIRRMSKLVSDLLTLARADSGVSSISKERFNLYDVAELVIRILQPVALEKKITLEVSAMNNIIVLADRERINQLLLILLDNAIKYTAEGGKVTLLIKTVNGLRQAVNIVVQDSGVGIPADKQQLIFERFYRIDKARSREEGGTGLGLSIAKWIADAHGGTIRVESNPGNGSSFIVSIPM